MEVTEEEFERLTAENATYKKEVSDLRDVVIGVCNVLGLSDENGKVKQEVLSGEENVMPLVLKSASGIVSSMMLAKAPGMGARKEKELAEKFHFIKKLVPIIDKYQNE
jgi:hypothetical protein